MKPRLAASFAHIACWCIAQGRIAGKGHFARPAYCSAFPSTLIAMWLVDIFSEAWPDG
jgi:hypothetical protein